MGTLGWGLASSRGLPAKLKRTVHAVPRGVGQEASSVPPASGATIRRIAYQAAACPPGSGDVQSRPEKGRVSIPGWRAPYRRGLSRKQGRVGVLPTSPGVGHCE